MSTDNTSLLSSDTVVINNNQNLLNVNMTNVTKLNSTNYLMWSKQVHALLDGYELARYIDGTTTVPNPIVTLNGVVSPNPEFTIWKRQDKLIYNSLLGAMTLSVQPLVPMQAHLFKSGIFLPLRTPDRVGDTSSS